MANWGKRWQWQLQFENPLGVQLRKKVKRESYNIYNIYIIKYILHFLPILHEAANFARGRLGISNCNCHCHRSFLKKGFQNKDANAYKSVRQRQWTGSCKNYELVHAKITSWLVQSYELAAWKLWVSKYKLPVNLYFTNHFLRQTNNHFSIKIINYLPPKIHISPFLLNFAPYHTSLFGSSKQKL